MDEGNATGQSVRPVVKPLALICMADFFKEKNTIS